VSHAAIVLAERQTIFIQFNPKLTSIALLVPLITIAERMTSGLRRVRSGYPLHAHAALRHLLGATIVRWNHFAS
jgi:hypothetical protein